MHSLTSAPLLFDLKIYRLLEVTRFWPPLNFPDINNELFYPLRQVTCGLKAAGLTLARALAGLQLAQDVSVVTGLTVSFSFSGWLDQQSPEGPYHEQSLWGNQAFSQWPQSARYRPVGCACVLYLNAMFGNSFEGCVYLGSLLVCVGGGLL